MSSVILEPHGSFYLPESQALIMLLCFCLTIIVTVNSFGLRECSSHKVESFFLMLYKSRSEKVG